MRPMGPLERVERILEEAWALIVFPQALKEPLPSPRLRRFPGPGKCPSSRRAEA